MAKVINLNRFRKRRAKAEKERRAERNRALHGRSKEERKREESLRQRLEKKLEGAFLIRDRVELDSLGSVSVEDDLEELNTLTARFPSLSDLGKTSLDPEEGEDD